ncbi:MAG TPA: hypothetical protein VF715_17505 [Thermoleophilaceae bacterium]
MSSEPPAPLGGPSLTTAISAAMVELQAQQISDGASDDVIDGRVAFQKQTEDEFTAAIERLTGRPVTAFLSANQTTPGVACELFFLEAPPRAEA